MIKYVLVSLVGLLGFAVVQDRVPVGVTAGPTVEPPQPISVQEPVTQSKISLQNLKVIKYTSVEFEGKPISTEKQEAGEKPALVVVPGADNALVRGYLASNPFPPKPLRKVGGKHLLIGKPGKWTVEVLAVKDGVIFSEFLEGELPAGDDDQEPPKPDPDPNPSGWNKDHYLVLIEESAERSPELAKLVNSEFWQRGIKQAGLNRPLVKDKDSESGKAFIREAKTFEDYADVPFMAVMDEDGSFVRSFELITDEKELRKVLGL